jgi:hypothetical protein
MSWRRGAPRTAGGSPLLRRAEPGNRPESSGRRPKRPFAALCLPIVGLSPRAPWPNRRSRCYRYLTCNVYTATAGYTQTRYRLGYQAEIAVHADQYDADAIQRALRALSDSSRKK